MNDLEKKIFYCDVSIASELACTLYDRCDFTGGTIYRPGNCNGNSTAATCEAEDIYKGCASLAV
jgi:hypothetical protein